MKPYQLEFFEAARVKFGGRPNITRSEAIQLSNSLGNGLPHWYLTKYNVGRNQYSFDVNMKKKWGDTYRKPESIESSVTVEKTVRAEADVKTEVQVEIVDLRFLAVVNLFVLGTVVNKATEVYMVFYLLNRVVKEERSVKTQTISS